MAMVEASVVHYYCIASLQHSRSICSCETYCFLANNRSSWPLDGPSSTFIKSTPKGECSRLIVYVALEAYRWISNAGSPLGAFPYFRLLVVFPTLLSSKQRTVPGSKSDIASRNSFRRWILSLLCDSDGICCIFFFVM